MRILKFTISIFFILTFTLFSFAQSNAFELYKSFSGNIYYTGFGKTFRSLPSSSNANAASLEIGPIARQLDTIPDGAYIRAAYIYWAASSENVANDDYEVSFGPSGSLQTINADRTWTHDFNFNGYNHHFYAGFADVTTIVQANGNTIYGFDNLDIYTGNPHYSSQCVLGGFSVVVIYEKPTLPYSVVNVYDGFDHHYAGSPIEVTLDNLLVSNVEKARFGHISWEGDATLSDNEMFEYRRPGAAYSQLTNALNPLDQQFNATMSIPGLPGAPGTGISDTTSYGLDFDVYDINNPDILTGDTYVEVRYSSGNDFVLLTTEILAITSEPAVDLMIDLSHNGSHFFIGQTNAQYTINTNNYGSMPGNNPVTVVVTLPPSANGITYDTWSGSGWNLDSVNDNVLTFSYNNGGSTPVIPSGGSLPPIKIDVNVGAAAAGQSHTVEANISSASYDNDLNNNTDTDDVTVDSSGLEVVKSSIVSSSPLYPDGVIDYTITITNSGSISQSNIVVTDPLPAGTSYVADSTVVTGHGLISKQFLDEFNTVAWNNNDGTEDWAAPWTEVNGVQVQNNRAEFTDNDNTATIDPQITRSADLTGISSTSLSLDVNGFSYTFNADRLNIEISSNGTDFTLLEEIPGTSSQVPQTYTYDITSYISSTTTVRIWVTTSSPYSQPLFGVDNVEITENSGAIIPVTKTNDGVSVPQLMDGVPADLTASGDNFILEPAASMTVTYQVQVVNDFWNNNSEPGLTNIASITSTQITEPQIGEVTDVVRYQSSVIFTDKDGVETNSYNIDGGDAYAFIKLTDYDQNLYSTQIETIMVTVTDPNTGDSELVLLRETGVNTGIFTNLGTGLLFAVGGIVIHNNGILTIRGNTSDYFIRVDYVDKDDSSDSSFDEATIPTLVVLSSFKTFNLDGQVAVEWKTASELGTVGFNLYRLDEQTDQFKKVNSNFLYGLLVHQQGGTYRFIDSSAYAGNTLTYQLEEIETNGNKISYGPFKRTCELENQTIITDIELINKGYSKQANSLNKRSVNPNRAVLQSTMNNSMRAALTKAKFDSQLSDDESDEVLTPEQTNQDSIYLSTLPRTRAACKISIPEEGMYYLTAAEIADVFNFSETQVKRLIKRRLIKLTNQGKKVVYLPRENNSGLCFYGKKIDSIYTDQNIYWLQIGRGLKMKSRNGGNPDPQESYGFKRYIKNEVNNYGMPGWTKNPDSDYWYWDYFIAGNPTLGTKNFPFEITSPQNDNSTAKMLINMHGASDSDASFDHHVIISLNDTQIADVIWDGATPKIIDVEFDNSILQTGENDLQIQSFLEDGVPYGFVYLNSFELFYKSQYKANNNNIRFSTSSRQPVTITNFQNSNILLFDISKINNPRLVINTNITNDGNGNYNLSFTPKTPTGNYIAVCPDSFAIHAGIKIDEGSRLKKKKNSADYLVITPSDFKETVNELTDYRTSQGLNSKIVMVEDIMDEFNYGIYSPHALKDFLTFVHQKWRNKPEYVLLCGSGSYDYKNNMGFDENRVPVLMTNTDSYGLMASDILYADVAGDDAIPEFSIGRLPAKTITELQNMIVKIKDYEAAYGSDWTKNILLISDDTDQGGDFALENNSLLSLMPHDFTINKAYLSDHTLAEEKSIINQNFSNGVGFVNYYGHGSMTSYGQEGIFTVGDVNALDNEMRLPIINAMTCLTGRFAFPGLDTLSESFVLKKGGGAIATYSPTGLSYTEFSKVLNKGIITSLYSDGNVTLGQSVIAGINYYFTHMEDKHTVLTYNLLGDPALRVQK